MNINNRSLVHSHTQQPLQKGIDDSTATQSTRGISSPTGEVREASVINTPPQGFDSQISSRAENPTATPKEPHGFEAKREDTVSTSVYEGKGERTNAGSEEELISPRGPRPLKESLQKDNYFLREHGMEPKEPQTKTLRFEGIEQGNVAAKKALFGGNKASSDNTNVEKNTQEKIIPKTETKAKEVEIKQTPLSETKTESPAESPSKIQDTVKVIESPLSEIKQDVIEVEDDDPVQYISRMFDESGQEITDGEKENALSLKLKEIENGSKEEIISPLHNSSLKDNFFLKLERGEITTQEEPPMIPRSRSNSISRSSEPDVVQASVVEVEEEVSTPDDVVSQRVPDEIDGPIGGNTEVEEIVQESIPQEVKPEPQSNIPPAPELPTTAPFGVVPPLIIPPAPPLPAQAGVNTNNVQGSTNVINVSVPDMVTPLADLLKDVLAKRQQKSAGDGGDGGGVSGEFTTRYSEEPTVQPDNESAPADVSPEDVKQAEPQEVNEPSKEVEPQEVTKAEEALKNQFPENKEEIEELKKDIGYTNVWQHVVNAGLSIAGSRTVDFSKLMDFVKQTINEVREEKISNKAQGRVRVSASAVNNAQVESESEETEEIRFLKANLKSMLQQEIGTGTEETPRPVPISIPRASIAPQSLQEDIYTAPERPRLTRK